MTVTDTLATIKASAATRSTATLMEVLLTIDAMPRATRDEAIRLVAAATADVIEARHDLTAALDAVFADLDFAGTHTDALVIALTVTGATI